MNAACEHSYLMDEETCFRVIKEIITKYMETHRQILFVGFSYLKTCH
jgi:hypothetical protein